MNADCCVSKFLGCKKTLLMCFRREDFIFRFLRGGVNGTTFGVRTPIDNNWKKENKKILIKVCWNLDCEQSLFCSKIRTENERDCMRDI